MAQPSLSFPSSLETRSARFSWQNKIDQIGELSLTSIVHNQSYIVELAGGQMAVFQGASEAPYLSIWLGKASSQNHGIRPRISRIAGKLKKFLEKKRPTGFLFDLIAYSRPPLINESFENQVTNVLCLMLGIEAGKGTQAELFAPAIDFLLVRFEQAAIDVNLAKEFLSDRNCGWIRHGVVVESL